MSSLILKLSAPLQSWGIDSKFYVRETSYIPSKSGVVGLIASAMGRDREDSIEDLASLKMAVRIDNPGSLLRDFQTITKENKTEPGADYVVTKYYLEGAVFLVALEGDEAFLKEIKYALENPKRLLFAGRRCCPFTEPITVGISKYPCVEALKHEDWAISDYAKEYLTPVPLEVVSDAEDGEDGYIVEDIPISFSPRRRLYAPRRVVHRGYIDLNDPMEVL